MVRRATESDSGCEYGTYGVRILGRDFARAKESHPKDGSNTRTRYGTRWSTNARLRENRCGAAGHPGAHCVHRPPVEERVPLTFARCRVDVSNRLITLTVNVSYFGTASQSIHSMDSERIMNGGPEQRIASRWDAPGRSGIPFRFGGSDPAPRSRLRARNQIWAIGAGSYLLAGKILKLCRE